ncbi:hypothetical protein CKAH01_10032 [Colletotrichum kahawae]|uniref:Uncharacterized protein n=1 Tax=Colletotrichum kahawae TaxID=34407 RepID=A0AAD9XZ02_COLKA|nr:hypothetical protein CKAH01_10032 [Colletotrichum kahawae]
MERWLPNYGPNPPAPEPARPQRPNNQEDLQNILQDPPRPQRPVGAGRIPDYGPEFADPDPDPQPWPEPIPEHNDLGVEEPPPAPVNNNDGAAEEELPENHWSRQIAPAAITHVTFGVSVPPSDDDVTQLLDEGYENIPYNYFKRTPHVVFNVRYGNCTFELYISCWTWEGRECGRSHSILYPLQELFVARNDAVVNNEEFRQRMGDLRERVLAFCRRFLSPGVAMMPRQTGQMQLVDVLGEFFVSESDVWGVGFWVDQRRFEPHVELRFTDDGMNVRYLRHQEQEGMADRGHGQRRDQEWENMRDRNDGQGRGQDRQNTGNRDEDQRRDRGEHWAGYGPGRLLYDFNHYGHFQF